MKKNGYTLAEVLITISIIGIVSALTLPLVNRLKPDTNKILYLKSYDSLVHASQKITTSNQYYHNLVQPPGSSKIYNIIKYPLLDTYTPYVDENNNTTNGVDKFYRMMYDFLAESSCGDAKNCFVTKNGVRFTITPRGNQNQTHVLTAGSSGTINLYYEVDIDVNGDKSPNADIDAAAIKDQDRFRFYITPDGTVVPIDKYGKMHIATRSQTRKSSLVDKSNSGTSGDKGNETSGAGKDSSSTTNLGAVNLNKLQSFEGECTAEEEENLEEAGDNTTGDKSGEQSS